MSSVVAAASSRAVFRKPKVSEVAALLAVAWLVPFVVHLIPWSGARPLGAYLLPMFWATFLAAYFYGATIGIVVGLFAPALNLLVTGLPALNFLGVLSCELVVFAVVTTMAIRRFPRMIVIAPLGYVVAKTFSTAVQATTGMFGEIGAPMSFFVSSVAGALAGLVVLVGINAALVGLYPKARNDGRE